MPAARQCGHLKVPMVIEWLIGLVGSSVGFAIGAALMRRRRARRLARDSQIDCGVQVVSGAHPDLTSGWTHGRAHVPAAGVVRFTPFRNGLTIAPGSPFDIEVSSVDDHGFTRRTPRAEAWAVHPGSVRVTLWSGTAELDVALLGDTRAFVESIGTDGEVQHGAPGAPRAPGHDLAAQDAAPTDTIEQHIADWTDVAEWPVVVVDDDGWPYVCTDLIGLAGCLEGSTDEVRAVFDSAGRRCNVTAAGDGVDLRPGPPAFEEFATQVASRLHPTLAVADRHSVAQVIALLATEQRPPWWRWVRRLRR